MTENEQVRAWAELHVHKLLLLIKCWLITVDCIWPFNWFRDCRCLINGQTFETGTGHDCVRWSWQKEKQSRHRNAILCPLCYGDGFTHENKLCMGRAGLLPQWPWVSTSFPLLVQGVLSKHNKEVSSFPPWFSLSLSFYRSRVRS